MASEQNADYLCRVQGSHRCFAPVDNGYRFAGVEYRGRDGLDHGVFRNSEVTHILSGINGVHD